MVNQHPRGGDFTKFSVTGSAHNNKSTRSDLWFCKNEGVKRSKIKEKRGSIGSKIKEKIDM